MTTIDYYEVLGVSKSATEKQLKDAYRQQAFQYHPDRTGGDAEAAEKMKQVNEAYAVLSNAQKRRQYDALQQQFGTDARQEFRRTYSDQDIFKDSDIWRVFEEMARQSGIRGFEEVFRPFYGPGFQHFECRRPGFFAKGFVFRGPMGRSGGPGKMQGRASRGPGFLKQGLLSLLLSAMAGKAGAQLPHKGADRSDTIQLTPRLSLEGGSYAYLHKPLQKKLIVKIPPGIRDGQRIRLAGMGDPGKNGAPAGDLYLKVRIHKNLTEKVKGLIESIFKK